MLFWEIFKKNAIEFWECFKESFSGWPIDEEPEIDQRVEAIIQRIGGPTRGSIWIGKEYQINDLLLDLKDIRDNPYNP